MNWLKNIKPIKLFKHNYFINKQNTLIQKKNGDKTQQVQKKRRRSF